MIEPFSKARSRMVWNQLERRGIRDSRVLLAMGNIPRERFIRHAARQPVRDPYADCARPIGRGQTLSQPYMVAAMTQALQIPKGARVLEIGTGTGYQTAVLAHIATEVWTVERDPVLASEAKGRLDDLGLKHVRLRVGDGSLGWKEGSPYQGILVTAGAPQIPPSLIEQLAPRGCLVIPIGPHDRQRLVRVTLNPDGTSSARETLMECRFVPLIGHEGWRSAESRPPDVAP